MAYDYNSEEQTRRARIHWGETCIIDECEEWIHKNRLCLAHFYCNVEGCEKDPTTSSQLCQTHYMRLRRKGTLDDERKNARQNCSVDDCDLKQVADGLCDKHYRRQRRYGTTDLPIKPDPERPGCHACGKPVAFHRSKYCSEGCFEQAKYHQRQATAREDWCKRHGITVVIYDEMLVKQGGGCGVCGSTDPKGRAGSQYFQIDHDHSCCPGRFSCGKCIRGLLCAPHNSMLGLAQDEPKTLLAGVRYLEGSAI